MTTRIVLDAHDFADLLEGRAVERDDVQIRLGDISWGVLQRVFDNAYMQDDEDSIV